MDHSSRIEHINWWFIWQIDEINLDKEITLFFFFFVSKKSLPEWSSSGNQHSMREESIGSDLFFVSCVISSHCIPNLEYQLINPTSQVSLLACCLGNCSPTRNITWNIYQGEKNSSSSTSNFAQWTRFNPTNLSDIYGQSSSFSLIVDCCFFSFRNEFWSIHRWSTILRSIFGDSKLFIHFQRRQVRVRWIPWSIDRPRMILVRFPPRMIQH